MKSWNHHMSMQAIDIWIVQLKQQELWAHELEFSPLEFIWNEEPMWFKTYMIRLEMRSLVRRFSCKFRNSDFGYFSLNVIYDKKFRGPRLPTLTTFIPICSLFIQIHGAERNSTICRLNEISRFNSIKFSFRHEKLFFLLCIFKHLHQHPYHQHCHRLKWSIL